MSPRVRYLSTTLALVAVGLGYALIQGKPWRPGPRLEAWPMAARSPAPRPPAPPTAREILERGAALSLTADQKAHLAGLDRKWREESAGLETALQAAEVEFSRFMKEAQAGGRTSLQEIQSRSAEASDLSASLRERRRIHAEVAARILTTTQRQELFRGTSPEPPGGIR
jgi:hypothetical protein